HVHPGEIELFAGILLALAERAIGVGEIDGAVAFDHDVVGAAESVALVIVGEHGALAVLFDPHQRAAREGGEDQAALTVDGEAVGPDHGEFLDPRIGALEAIVLDAAPAPHLGALVAGVVESANAASESLVMASSP